MWQKKWSWSEAFAIVGGLTMVGLALQLSIGPVPHTAFAYPVNICWGILLVAAVAIYTIHGQRGRAQGKKHRLFFAGQVATLSSIAGLLAVLVIMGFTKQIPVVMSQELANPIHRIGFSSILSTWYFLLLYVYMLFVLGCTTVQRLTRLRRSFRDFAFLMNHLGLFIVLLFGLIAAADVQRYRMQVNADSEYPEWRGIHADTDQMEELPIAIELKEFNIVEYPPKLMIIGNVSGKPLPIDLPQHLSTDAVGTKGQICDWEVEILEYLPYSAAVPTKDSIVFREFRTTGAVHSAKVRATHPASATSHVGWVAAGSHLFPYRSLRLSDSLSLVMAEPEPKQFSSRVMLYAQDGGVDSAEIKVNTPFKYKDWYIYQLSYDKEKGRWSRMSEFELVHDTWLTGVYVGFFMLLLGAACLFLGPLPASPSSPITQKKRHEKPHSPA